MKHSTDMRLRVARLRIGGSGLLMAGVGYFDQSFSPTSSPMNSGEWDNEAEAAVQATDDGVMEGDGSLITHHNTNHDTNAPPPIPPPIPPSAAAAKAATNALKARLGSSIGASMDSSTASSPGSSAGGKRGGEGELSMEALAAIVSDSSGVLAAAAAEVTCWEMTEVPAELAGLLREHTIGHIRAFDCDP